MHSFVALETSNHPERSRTNISKNDDGQPLMLRFNLTELMKNVKTLIRPNHANFTITRTNNRLFKQKIYEVEMLVNAYYGGTLRQLQVQTIYVRKLTTTRQMPTSIATGKSYPHRIKSMICLSRPVV